MFVQLRNVKFNTLKERSANLSNPSFGVRNCLLIENTHRVQIFHCNIQLHELWSRFA